MAYDAYRNSAFDPPGFNPNTNSSNNNQANNNNNIPNSIPNNANSNPPNAAYGYLQPPYGENYAAEQDTHPPAHPQQQQQQQVPPYGPSSTYNQGTDYPDPSSFYPPPGHPPQHGDALKPPFSPTAPRQGPPPPPRVPDPSYPSPDLIAQVTAAVIQQLRVANPGNNPPPPPPPPHPPLQQQNYQPPTPALSNTSYKPSPNPDTLSPNTATGPYIPPPSSISAQPDLSNAPVQPTYPPPIPSKFDGNTYTSPLAQHPPSRP
ncbi:hypothetical protein FQN49_006489, partial [Arthroderma sp. PD_2]